MVQLRANTIIDSNAHNICYEYVDWCNRNSSCIYKNKKRKFHGWINLHHLIFPDMVAQCGWDSGNCNHSTAYGIAGYHNVCPIAGINGDFVWPAKLQLFNFDFRGNDITESAKIQTVKVHFEHRMVAADVGTGRLYDNFGPNFYGNGWVCRVYFTNNNNELVSEVKYINTNPRLSKRNFYSIDLTFNDLTVEELLNQNFALNIEYNHNHNTNPGIIYLKNAILDVDFENAEMFISGYNSSDTLYTSADSSTCSSTITQTITAGYQNSNGIIPTHLAPQKLGEKIICIDKPEGVIVQQRTVNDTQKTFRIRDNSNIEGKKTITYRIDGYPQYNLILTYTAIKKNKPTYNIVQEYKSNEDFNPNKAYIIVKDGCASEISIYADSIESEPLILNVANQDNTNNLLDKNAIEDFHTFVTSLNCGYHTLYIKRGNEDVSDVANNKVVVKISPMKFKFNIYTNENNNHTLDFIQSKSNRYSNILIERVDNEPCETIPTLNIIDETQMNTIFIEENVDKGDIITHSIDKYYAGEFYIKTTTSDFCTEDDTTAKVIITGSHKQNYDYLFTRGEDGTAFDFDYLVAWEGDNLKEPLIVDSIDFTQSINDIRICSNSAQSGLSQIGLVELRIKNKTDKVLQGIEIELNTLIRNDDNELEVTTGEWVEPDGIFNQFYSLFYEYNSIKNQNIQILNLTPDNDLVDEENVYILINEIDSMDIISLYLPFRSSIEKTVYLQYLLCESPLHINSIENCEAVTDENFDRIEINVQDSMLTQLEIAGNTDLLQLDSSYSCPTECYTTKDSNDNPESGGITYKITNIDTNDFKNQLCQTKIINDNELQPYGYILNDIYYPLIDNNGNRIEVQERNPMTDNAGNQLYEVITDSNGIPILDSQGNLQDDLNKPLYKPNKVEWVYKEEIINKPLIKQNIKCFVKFFDKKEIKYEVKTNKNGIADFYIPIPASINRKYTVNELLSEVLYFKFEEQIEYNGSVLTNMDIPQPEQKAEKNNTILIHIDDYKRYKPNDVVNIKVMLSADTKILKNYLTFNAELHNIGESDQVTVLYKICNIKNNEGIFKTTFETSDKQLIPNSISKNIYCGIDTEIKVNKKIEKQVIESRNINVIYLDVINQKKENKDVNIKINLGKNPPQYEGDYDFLDINIEDGDYSIIEEDQNLYINWLIGEMDAFETKKAIIKIKAQDVGLSHITIQPSDYLHNGETDIEIKGNECEKCKESTWKRANSLWIQERGIFYKLFPDGTYKKPGKITVKNGKYQRKWVNKK